MSTIKFDTELIKGKIQENGVPSIKISTVILGRSKSYMNKCFDKGSMGEIELERLCMYLGVAFEDAVVKEPIVSEEPKEEVKEVSSISGEGTYNEKLDLLTVGINTLYETQSDTNKLLMDLIQEIKVSNQKMERIEKRLGTMENATAQTLSKSIMMVETQQEMEKHFREAKSTLAFIKGRTTDIQQEVCAKPQKRKLA